jgi:hypothetical protein
VTRRLLALALVCVLLGAWERALAGRARKARGARTTVGRLLPSAEREAMPIAAVRVLEGDGTQHLYARGGGRWRCLTLFDAPADGDAIGALVERLSEAEGTRLDVPSDALATYGIGTSDTLRVQLCGAGVLSDPSGDVLAAFDLGRRLPARGGGFARRVGTPEVWEIDSDPRDVLEQRVAPHLPPLLATGIVPAAFSGQRAGVRTVRAASGGVELFALTRRTVELTPEEVQNGIAPFVFDLTGGGATRPASGQHALAYTVHLLRARWADLLDPREADALRRDPAAVIELRADDGEAATLLLGAPRPDGAVAVWSRESAAHYLVSGEVAALLVPTAAELTDPAAENRWEAELRR